MRIVLISCLVGFTGCILAAGEPAKPTAIEAIGKGVQIYRCTASGPAYAWSLKAPEATLSDASGKVIGKHFAGPTWQAQDGSTVVGQPVNVSPAPNAGAIPWLVLRARAHTGSGQMDDVQYVVRTRTEGGQAPISGCDASHVNAEVRVPYSATYTFFRG